jgi:hypothetical protein
MPIAKGSMAAEQQFYGIRCHTYSLSTGPTVNSTTTNIARRMRSNTRRRWTPSVQRSRSQNLPAVI